jgi:hypothetical protein
MVGRHPVAQIRREQQWGVAIDVYETVGHELLVAFPRPITGLVSKRPQAFSFSSLSETARRGTFQIFFYDGIPAAKSDRLLGGYGICWSWIL